MQEGGFKINPYSKIVSIPPNHKERNTTFVAAM